MVNEKNAFSRQLLMFPVECREGGTTYQGNLEIDVRKFLVKIRASVYCVFNRFFTFGHLGSIRYGIFWEGCLILIIQKLENSAL